ncbi:MAG: hypothetical protein KA340_14105, partial [Saprospiraceae bacterium]|nr:hypothetical protein [Saprospiraceae bacterium]
IIALDLSADPLYSAVFLRKDKKEYLNWAKYLFQTIAQCCMITNRKMSRCIARRYAKRRANSSKRIAVNGQQPV